ncbi:MAG: ABC transporter permease, partial [Betaproteobacteria bacterium]|nr:ABC transporter permease [Betaproteobacteria bacterium]
MSQDAAVARNTLADFIRRNPTIVVGGVLLTLITLAALLAPLIARDPIAFEPINRLRGPSFEFWLGTDSLGRDVYARMIYGARISLLVGLSVALISVVSGAVVGLLAGYFSRFDAIVMRLMDGIMAIPSILLAIALVALLGSSVKVVIIAIAIPEIPRVTRLVRAVVLSVRDLPFVEAARSNGTRVAKLLRRHILPSTVAPLIVQATYICASAILTEAGLSFLGAGTPPEFPT